MAFVNLPYNFQNGASADATQVDANFTAITNQVNGGLDLTNLANSAYSTSATANTIVVRDGSGNIAGVSANHSQSRIPILNGSQQSTEGTSATSILTASPVNVMPFVFNASEWTNNTFYVEAFGYAGSGGTAYFALWDKTSGSAIAASSCSTASTSATVTRSGSFSLTDGHVYYPTFWSSSGSVFAYIYSMHILQLL